MGVLILGCGGCGASEAADDQALPASNPWVEVYSDNAASGLATFQSHVRKLRDHDGALTLAYTNKVGKEDSTNRVVRIPHDGTARTLRVNTTPSNAGCIVVWKGSVHHVFADFRKKVLRVDPLDGSAPVEFPDFQTAGKTTCRVMGDDLLAATSYGALWRIENRDGAITKVNLRETLVLEKPESLQYPYIVDGPVADGAISLFNTSSMVGFYYRDFYMSECNSNGVCGDFKGTFPRETRAANSWVGDVARTGSGELVAYWTENDHHFAPMDLFFEPEDSIGHIGVFSDGSWTSIELGPRIMSARFLRREDDLVLVTMTIDGDLFIDRIGDDLIKNGLERIVTHNFKISCAYGLDADYHEDVLSLMVTDRGPGCDNPGGTVRVWRHTLAG